jgi:hypothetical protein
LIVDTTPVAEVVVEAAPVPGALVLWPVVPAWATSVSSTAFRAVALTVAVDPAGSVTVSTRAPTGGGGGVGEGEGLGGGEQHSAAMPVAPFSVPGQA